MSFARRSLYIQLIDYDDLSLLQQLGGDGTLAAVAEAPKSLAKIDKIKLPNTKVKLLQKLLQKAVGEVSKTNKVQAVDFTKKF